MRLEQKIGLVTGAGQGIGEAIAHRLAEEGALVTVNDVQAERAENSAAAITEAGGRADAHACDMTDAAAVQAMVDGIVDRHGRIDFIVNNAGVLRDNLIHNMPEEDWDFVIDTNLKSCFLAIKAAAPHMREQHYGRICSISSRAWLGNRGQANYSASKAGIIGLTRAVALELAKYDVSINVIAPGLIDTPLIQSLRPDVQEQLKRAQPTPHIGKPRDIANAVLFLVSDEAWYITGQVLHVDGGKSLGARNT